MAPPTRKPPPPTEPPLPDEERFIGHESSTMLTEETFEEFEARMKPPAAAKAVPATVTVPALRPGGLLPSRVEDEPLPSESWPETDTREPSQSAAGDDEWPATNADADAEVSDTVSSQRDPDEHSDTVAARADDGERPLDQYGDAWDYVTPDGEGFNDSDDEDAMTTERFGETMVKEDWAHLDRTDWVGFWKISHQLEAAMANDDDAEYAAALEKLGFRNRNHWKRVQATFLRNYAEDDEFTNAAVVARQEGVRSAMRDAVKPGMLEPIEGVSLQLYAGLSARQGSAGAGFAALLAENGLDEAKFARVGEAWMARMADASDPMAAAAIATEYGKAFASAGAGQFGASAAAASASMGINDAVAGKNAAGAAGSMTFERYVEVMTAQTCWADQGKDVNAQLLEVFGLTAVDWSNASAYWSQRMSSDVKLIRDEFPALQARFMEQYS